MGRRRSKKRRPGRCQRPERRSRSQRGRGGHLRAALDRGRRLLGLQRLGSARERNDHGKPGARPRSRHQQRDRGCRWRHHACAVLATGSVDCWGSNLNGELGDGTDSRSTPVAVSGLSDAVGVSAQLGYACAVRSTGGVACWGSNAHLVLGSEAVFHTVTPLAVGGLTNAVAVSTNQTHACAVRADGTAVCWGENVNGDLGDGMTANSATPVTVSGLGNAIAISAGFDHTCALLANGSAGAGRRRIRRARRRYRPSRRLEPRPRW